MPRGDRNGEHKADFFENANCSNQVEQRSNRKTIATAKQLYAKVTPCEARMRSSKNYRAEKVLLRVKIDGFPPVGVHKSQSC